MKNRYDPSSFENKFVKLWDESQIYKTVATPTKRMKKYVLSMFPYPSGAGLHAGHVRIYTATDILARYYRMKGFDVLSPMGWDAFGLPAENAAIKQKRNPAELTKEYIANFKKQIKSLGMAFDWSREIDTTNPDYYAITQWLFIQFFKHGLLYKKDTPVYYCNFCKTGLAQEEVLADGTHERCGNPVTQKNLPQWMFRITKYSDELLKGLDGLEWPKGILEMQKNWIGKKEGMIISHTIEGIDDTLDTFTAYPQWSFADTFIVVAPEHPLIGKIKDQRSKIKDEKLLSFIDEMVVYIDHIRSIPAKEREESKEKTGVFTGYYADDPFRPGVKMPIWVANFALMDVGTGAVRCSAHDPRDFEFAKKYSIPLRQIVNDDSNYVHAHDNKGRLVDSGPFTGREVGEIEGEFAAWVEKEKIGKKKTTYHLRDWIFSRQRYWGEPIPMVYCQTCADSKINFWESDVIKSEKLKVQNGGEIHLNNTKVDQKSAGFVNEIKNDMVGWFPLSEESLPSCLPNIKSYEPNMEGKSPLADHPQWYKTTCPHCGGEAVRETDTMPNWAGSCWYFLQFAMQIEGEESLKFKDQSGKSSFLENWKLKMDHSGSLWLPVDIYIGGAEHAVLHLLYARFWMYVMHEMGLVPLQEPFKSFHSIGIVLAEDNRKMSKSWGNVVNPDDIVSEYGADTMRVYEMFMAPFSQQVAWSTSSMQGSYRFLKRIWQIYTDPARLAKKGEKSDAKLYRELQALIGKIESDITNVKFNTSVSSMMEFVNLWDGSLDKDKDKKLSDADAKIFLQLLAPFAPFIADELWQTIFQEKRSIHVSKWPVAKVIDDSADIINIPVQVQGKVRGVVGIDKRNMTKENVLNRALEQENIVKWLEGKSYDVLYVEGKILNIILT